MGSNSSEITSNAPSLGDLATAANEAAGTARTVVTAMLGTAVTLAATILASSDEAIFRDQLNAPFGIGASIRLSIAYALMPPVFLFLHVNTLLQLNLLSERITAFEARLKAEVALRSARIEWRRKLAGFAFVQYAADDEEESEGTKRLLSSGRYLLTWVVVQTSIALVPLTILLGTQLSFLRYQSEPITLVHRVSVLLDLAMILWFGLSQFNRTGPRAGPHFVTISAFALLIAYCIAWFFGFTGATCMSIVNGLVTGWGISVLAKFSGRPIPIYVFGLLSGTLLWWVISATVENYMGWLAASISSILLARIVARRRCLASNEDVGPRHQLSTLGKVTEVAMWVLPSAAVVWLSMTQATLPDGAEEACQIRWGSNEYGEDELALTAGTVSERREERSNFLFSIVLLPAFGGGDLQCSPLGRHAQGPNAQIPARANILDRWLCPDVGIGCRYLSLASANLFNASFSTSVVDALGLEDAATQDTKYRLIGAVVRDRHFLFGDFRSARLFGVDWRGSVLDRANLFKANLQAALLDGSYARNADFREAQLQLATISLAYLDNSDFSQANLQNVKISDTEARRARFYGADMRGADLNDSDFERAQFLQTKMQRANLSLAVLRRAEFSGTLLQGARLTGTMAESVMFGGAHLEGADLSSARLQNAFVQNAYLNGASLSSASLQDASFDGAVLDGATLVGADFSSAQGVFKSCKSILNTKLRVGVWSAEDRDALKQKLIENGYVPDEIYDPLFDALRTDRVLWHTKIDCDSGWPKSDSTTEAWAASRVALACSDSDIAHGIVIAAMSSNIDLQPANELLISRLSEAAWSGSACPGVDSLPGAERASLLNKSIPSWYKPTPPLPSSAPPSAASPAP